MAPENDETDPQRARLRRSLAALLRGPARDGMKRPDETGAQQ